MSYHVGNTSQDDYNAHIKLKNDGLELKEIDKKTANNMTTLSITADTESLLTAPHQSNMMFFHTELNLHNFTFYDLKTREVLNYVWYEVHGELEASNFTTCYIDYLSKLVEQNPAVKNVILWSDRCNILSSTLLNFAIQHSLQICHKYLEVGHTHMECDSMHSNVEKVLKHENVNLPVDYIYIIGLARKGNPGKYGVKYIDYIFFKNFKVCDIKTIKPSRDVGAPYMVDLRQL